MLYRWTAGVAPPRPRLYDPKAASTYDLSLGVTLRPPVGCGDDEVSADAANGACSRYCGSTSNTDKFVLVLE
jgi:hypothetical protein